MKFHPMVSTELFAHRIPTCNDDGATIADWPVILKELEVFNVIKHQEPILSYYARVSEDRRSWEDCVAILPAKWLK